RSEGGYHEAGDDHREQSAALGPDGETRLGDDAGRPPRARRPATALCGARGSEIAVAKSRGDFIEQLSIIDAASRLSRLRSAGLLRSRTGVKLASEAQTLERWLSGR